MPHSFIFIWLKRKEPVARAADTVANIMLFLQRSKRLMQKNGAVQFKMG